ncbi:hypothetical protein Tco_0552432, partial [Tanacetum coccineum]
MPLGGPPGQLTIQPQFFFNRDLDYLLTGDKERRIALSISKLKAKTSSQLSRKDYRSEGSIEVWKALLEE